MRILINTGGGDAPGLNAVIRAVTLTAVGMGFEVYGSRQGYMGLLEAGDGIIPLTRNAVRGITYLGGTILGTTNRGNPFEWPTKSMDGEVTRADRSQQVIATFRRFRFDALIAVGGDGSLAIAHRFHKLGLPVVGVPKTIDNDIAGTDLSFGFDTACDIATDALGRLHSTAEAHDRVMVVEVMGRYAGWIALYSGLGATADAILIPEIPFDYDKVCDKIMDRELHGRHFSIVVVAEGAAPKEGQRVARQSGEAGRQEPILGGISEIVAKEIAQRTGKDTRTVVLGHLQRGGTPTAYDRRLSLRFGSAAVRAASEKKFGTMVAYKENGITTVPLETALMGRPVNLDSDVMATARALGIAFGD